MHENTSALQWFCTWGKLNRYSKMFVTKEQMYTQALSRLSILLRIWRKCRTISFLWILRKIRSDTFSCSKMPLEVDLKQYRAQKSFICAKSRVFAQAVLALQNSAQGTLDPWEFSRRGHLAADIWIAWVCVGGGSLEVDYKVNQV